MKFEFSFEVLLDHKRKLENEARRQFMEAQVKVDEATVKLNEFYDQVDRARGDSQKLQRTGGLLAPALVANSDFISGQKFRIEAQRMKIRDLKLVADELQEAMVECAKETKTLEKLRERSLDEYKKERRKREAKETDEIVVLRHKRPGAGT
jgi:flagellar export protein FliJ